MSPPLPRWLLISGGRSSPIWTTRTEPSKHPSIHRISRWTPLRYQVAWSFPMFFSKCHCLGFLSQNSDCSSDCFQLKWVTIVHHARIFLNPSTSKIKQGVTSVDTSFWPWTYVSCYCIVLLEHITKIQRDVSGVILVVYILQANHQSSQPLPLQDRTVPSWEEQSLEAWQQWSSLSS